MQRPQSTTNSEIPVRTTIRVAILLILALAAAGCGSASAVTEKPRHVASASVRPLPHHVVRVSGTYVGHRQVITNIQPDGAEMTYDVRGRDDWAGTTTGTSTYTGHGRYDPATGEVWEWLDETFTGSIPGFGAGTLRFADYLHVPATGHAHTWCVATHGTGGLRGVHGGIDFTTIRTEDADSTGNGIGYGTITGALLR